MDKEDNEDLIIKHIAIANGYKVDMINKLIKNQVVAYERDISLPSKFLSTGNTIKYIKKYVFCKLCKKIIPLTIFYIIEEP
jgi:hypothetical protein